MPALSHSQLYQSCGLNAFGRSLISTTVPFGAKRTWMRTFCGSIVFSFSNAGAEAQELDGDILGTQHFGLAGEPRLRTDADDGVQPLVFLAGALGDTLSSLLHVDMAGAAFGLAIALVEDAHFRTKQRGQQRRSLGDL